MMVRGSLDLGVQAVVAITFGELEFVNSKRKIQLSGGHLSPDIPMSESVGKDGLRYLVAWSFYRKLIKYTVPRLLRNYVSANTACYGEIKEFMNLAVMSSYFTSVVPPRLIYQTKRMAYRIRSAFEKALNSSNWIGRDIRDELINKLIDVTFYVGSQGRRSDPAFVEEVYRPYPDSPQEPFFPTWMKVLSLSSHYTWTDQNALLYNEAAPNGFYIIPYNDIVVSPGIMQSPFLYLYGPIALNYGGLGMLSLSGQHETLNDTVDSENLADLVGTMVAYAAYSSSPQKYKDVKLVNLDISTERLFFINHCVKCWRREPVTLCSTTSSTRRIWLILLAPRVFYVAFTTLPLVQWDVTLPGVKRTAEHLFFIGYCIKVCVSRYVVIEKYTPDPSRCIVPIMNMAEFSDAFECAPGSRMDPSKKCAFWP
ncbi:neprilysin-1 [Rhipicephalus microplus]|uniref:neprilysin-1 n=1 Tax=Rhipicephalus microplus TaxID=6941 RepID=UPI003F6D9A0C